MTVSAFVFLSRSRRLITLTPEQSLVSSGEGEMELPSDRFGDVILPRFSRGRVGAPSGSVSRSLAGRPTGTR